MVPTGGSRSIEATWVDVSADLGNLAPDPRRARSLRARMDRIRAAKVKAESFTVWINDQEDIVNHDAMTFIDEVAGDIRHLAQKRPQIATRYPHILAIAEQRSQSISDGMARARAARDAEAAKHKADAEAQQKVQQEAAQKDATQKALSKTG